jgi:ribosomal protein S18 acetylase RimI-like enzyme
VPVVDWREVDPGRMASLFDREAARWHERLDWDYAPTRRMADGARSAGSLPGFVALDDRSGDVTGWTFFLVHRGVLQVGAVVADRADVVRSLLDRVLDSPEASLAQRYQVFAFPVSGSLEVALFRRRFVVEPYHYLTTGLAGLVAADAAPLEAATAVSTDDLSRAARLLARAYAGTASARVFAPGGRLDEWAGYLGQLRHTEACGRWMPEACLGVRHPHDDRLTALVVTTRIADRTAHIAQVVVDPLERTRGLGTALVRAAAAAAARAGASRLSLLVAGDNAAARSLYARLGFVEHATFLFADRPRLTRGAGLPGPASDARSPVRAAGPDAARA